MIIYILILPYSTTFTIIFQLLETKLEQDVGNQKAYGAALTTQIDGLRMIPMLFGMINF